MRYAILGDIHGNWEALGAVLADAKEHAAKSFVCVGDVVGYNPDPDRCLDRVRELCCANVQGNHDYYCAHPEAPCPFTAAAAEAIEWTRNRLTGEQLQYLKDLGPAAQVDGFGVVHNTMEQGEQWKYVFSVADAERNFGSQCTAVCFHGHTHVPLVYERQKRVSLHLYSELQIEEGVQYFVNVGSVGQPRDRDSRAAYALYDTQERAVALRRVPYDVAATQKKIYRAGLPVWLALRLGYGV